MHLQPLEWIRIVKWCAIPLCVIIPPEHFTKSYPNLNQITSFTFIFDNFHLFKRATDTLCARIDHHLHRILCTIMNNFSNRGMEIHFYIPLICLILPKLNINGISTLWIPNHRFPY